MSQKRLTGAERHSLEMVRYHLANVKWKDILGGYEFWVAVQDKIGAMLRTNTNDGTPWVEPERWRVPTDEDAKLRPKCRYRDTHGEEWKRGTLLYTRHAAHTAHPFFIVDGCNNVIPFRYCEILDNETKTE